MNEVHILADDLTGALDSAAAFAGDVPVFLDTPETGGGSSFPVSVVATASRDVPIEALPEVLAPSLRWLGDAKVAFKKIDSLLRGNTFVECAFVARSGGFQRIAFVPAFPQQGRITTEGRQWVIPPGAPAADRRPVGAAPLAAAFSVLGVPVKSTDASAADPLSVWIPNVRTDDDLASVATVSAQDDAHRWLWCGSAGLAHAIAAHRGMAPEVPPVAFHEATKGPVLLISASHHPVVRQQWDVLKVAESGVIMAVHGQRASLRAAFRAMGHPFELAMFDLSPNRLLSPDEAAARLARQLDEIARESPHPSALVVVGGDTLRALCRAAGVHTLMAHASPRTGWGCARLVGGVWDDVACYSRSGAFGDPDDLSTMVRLVVRRAKNQKEHRT